MARAQKPGIRRGRISCLLPKLVPDLFGHSAFVTCCLTFIEACKAAARALGANDEPIHTEGYYPRYPPITPKPEQLPAGS